MPINKEAIAIFTSLTKNILLKAKRFLFFKKINNNNPLNQDEIVVATTISSWFNGLLLLIFLKNKNLFAFNKMFFVKLVKIAIASLFMGIFFNFILNFFQNELAFDQNLKSFYLVLSVVLGLLFYLIVSYWIKAFKISDIKLKY